MASITLDQVLNCPGLPSLPAVAVEVLHLARNRDVQLEQIARVIQNDPALCARILKTVNSSFFGLSKPCPTITRALAYLGLNTVKSLVLGFSLVDWIETSEDVEYLRDYWQRSVCTATAARRLASLTGTCEPEEAFVAALVQDIGVLAIRRAAGTLHRAVAAQCDGNHDRLVQACRNQFGFDHPTVGAALAEKWRFPDSIVQTIRNHHAPLRELNNQPPLVQVVAHCNHLVSAFNSTASGATLHAIQQHVRTRFGLNDAQMHSFITGAIDDARELSQLLPGLIGGVPDAAAMLAQAEDVRIAHQLELQREADQLKQDNRELMKLAVTDPLTGIGNRKEFQSNLSGAIKHARSFKGRLALLMVDIDHFKVVNDTHGHMAGDFVLQELARRMRAVIESAGTVCRYGGEEFAIILPGFDRPASLKAAEAIRRAVAEKPFSVEPRGSERKLTPVTVSVGVALYESNALDEDAASQSLLIAADKAMYAAKNSGRNAVRVHQNHLRKMSA